MDVDTESKAKPATEFRHEALFYADESEFVQAAVPFIADGLARREPVMVAVSARKIRLLRANLGWDGHWVDFVDMAALGTNPARIISAWRKFVTDNRTAAHLRGIGEPVWVERTSAEMDECERHEMLLNAAFSPERRWRLLCPYDTSALDGASIDKARCTHPFVQQGENAGPSPAYQGGVAAFAAALQGALPEPPNPWRELTFDATSRFGVQPFVLEAAETLTATKAFDLARSVDELVENSLAHGGGRGTLRTWRHGADVVCEVSDRGRIHDPLVGRGLPPRPGEAGRGVWLVHELCDFVELRSSSKGTVVRLTMRGPEALR